MKTCIRQTFQRRQPAGRLTRFRQNSKMRDLRFALSPAPTLSKRSTWFCLPTNGCYAWLGEVDENVRDTTK